MSGVLKRLGIIILISAVLFANTVSSAAISDNGVWEDSKLCVFLEADGESNSDLCFAAVKVKIDRSVHRIYLLFMLEFDDFNDDMLSGVIMNFNGLGEVRVMSDGTAEYNDNVYYAELNDELADEHSMNILLEVTVGIKSGIPDNLLMDVNVIDTNSVKSNKYSVDISEDEQEDTEAEEENSPTAKTAKTKTTKAKTTKVKTTKVKTTKPKTTKTKKSTTKNDEYEDEEEIQTVIVSDGVETVSSDNGRKKLAIALGAAAAVVAAAAGCATGIKKKKNVEDKKDEK